MVCAERVSDDDSMSIGTHITSVSAASAPHTIASQSMWGESAQLHEMTLDALNDEGEVSFIFNGEKVPSYSLPPPLST